MKLIEASNLTVGYKGMPVCQDISFSVNEGDYLCIVGENGSGKSTLMKTLLGLIPKLSGEILINKELIKSSIGFLPQQAEINRQFPASVKEVVLSGFVGKNKGVFYKKEFKEEAKEKMSLLHIENLSNKLFSNLSGGQRQKVLLARALCACDKLLLLDEPVTGLDPKAQEEMYELIDYLNKKEKISIIMISHDIESVLKYASHILLIKDSAKFFTIEEYVKKGENHD